MSEQADTAARDAQETADPPMAPSQVEEAIGALLQAFMQLAADIDDAETGAAADAALVRLDAVMAGATGP